MTNYEQLVKGVENSKNLEEYFLDFFTKDNLKNYEINSELSPYEVKAVKHLFKSKKDLRDRIDEALEMDALCMEALFAYMMLTEDLFLSYRFEHYYKEVVPQYYELTKRQKNDFIVFMEYYLDFLIDISNITKAIKVLKTIIKITNDHSEKYISKLAKLYHYNEDVEGLYRLYQYNEFTFKDYLLLLLTLLKHEDENRAKDILSDMFEKIEYSEYIDHIWEIDEDDPKQKQIATQIEELYDDLLAVPDFFSWISRIKEGSHDSDE